jgi:hypothetical protein
MFCHFFIIIFKGIIQQDKRYEQYQQKVHSNTNEFIANLRNHFSEKGHIVFSIAKVVSYISNPYYQAYILQS